MFKLQRLEITGFKSFADYTEVVFTGSGITAVVGPNGCGKSNVSDAISWVLGEQRARSLRGGEMKDVVFQGTKNRQPSGMAEVVLHLVRDENALSFEDAELAEIDETLSEIDEMAVDVDSLEADAVHTDLEEIADPGSAVRIQSNGFHAEEVAEETVKAVAVGSVQTVERTVKTKRHWRPRSFALDFAPGEAVSVTRRLYLSGESEYLLNGKTCRLRDIQDLFAGTGLSGAHYAIIEQGRIGQILSAKPADRRNLIEEAAGISKFRTRQRAAESRLESAKTNLGRISDIVSEVDKQAASLRRQAAKTRRFVVLQEEFRVLLRQLYAAEGRHFSDAIDQLGKRLADEQARERSLGDEVVRQEEMVREATSAARAAEESLSALRAKHADNALDRDRAEREHRYQTGQIADLEDRVVALDGEIQAAEERASLAASEFQRLEEEDQKESAEVDATRLILVEAEKRYSEKMADVQTIEAEMDIRRDELMRHASAVERFDEIARQLAFNLERLTTRSEGLKVEAMRAEETRAEHVAEAEKAVAELASEREKLASYNAEKQEIHAAAETAREKLASAEAMLRAAHNEHSRTLNRLETLRELEEKRAVYAPQIQKFFGEQAKIGVRPLGVLADFLSVDERFERAVESVFGQYLQAVVVKDLGDARKVADWLRANRIGRVSVLIAPGARPASNRTGSGSNPESIVDVLGAASELTEVLRQAFPREMSARIVADLASARSEDAGLLVTETGEMLAGGSLYVSSRETADGTNDSLLAFKRELASLSESEALLARDLASAESVVAVARKELAEVEEKAVDLQSVIIKVERHLLSLEINEKNLRQEIERAERHARVVADEIGQVTGEIAEVGKKIEDAKANRLEADSLRSAAQAELDTIAASLINARELASVENTRLNEKRTLAATSDERRRAVHSALRRIEQERKELELRIGQLRAETSTAREKIVELRASVGAIETRLNGVEAELAAEKAELDSEIEKVAAARAAADLASTGLAELNRRASEAMNGRAAVEVSRAEAMTELKNLHEHCLQEINIELSDLVESETLPDDFLLEDARERSETLRRRLEGFGAINMLAVEELAEAEERLLFLTSQRQDIIDSIASAEEALREIKDRSRERFKNAFEAINANFQEYFAELFGGGRGEMSLLESDDILEAGIEVIAQPPGKRLQNILLLSGGEKAMTAIALVLAIFKYRPSPFCLLDEVDAPLDDANVGRFVNKIAEMSANTQFIVITHNKRTMEAARALYGVTMQEAGVSKVVSVKFE
ncbi:MAG TPA: chromosome segregation protein SMC [Pyrinomonadaceae bacterium]|nr:chromosome segregation protein SMC [Pyrinomonadaceae bacterium]HMP65823.1 chromosome segregation protein SMC [Pyrinomonadaceae bacterium]